MPEKAGEWKTQKLKFNDAEDIFTIRYRNPIAAIRSLWRDGQLSPEMVFAGCKIFSDEKKENRIFSEMHTGKWWHVLQVRLYQSFKVSFLKYHQSLLPKGATLAPVIIATDKTQLTQFSGNKSDYPVYLTIGNILKATRRKPSKQACVLIAYLSVEKMDRSRITEEEHRSQVKHLFHKSMHIVLEPLINAGINGIEMISSDGSIRRVYPILTCYVADYPEQCLVACTKYGTCPKCRVSAEQLEDPHPTEKRTQKWTEAIITEGKNQAKGRPQKLHTYCMSFDVAGGVYRPFWEGFPLCDIHSSITPDVLHQLYQGVFKHLVNWCQSILTPQELDQRIRALPPAFGLRQFKKGIFALSQISGTESKNMAKILLGCLIGCMPSKGILAITALLDFIYLAQYSTHDSLTLGYMQNALDRFHKNRNSC